MSTAWIVQMRRDQTDQGGGRPARHAVAVDLCQYLVKSLPNLARSIRLVPVAHGAYAAATITAKQRLVVRLERRSFQKMRRLQLLDQSAERLRWQLAAELLAEPLPHRLELRLPIQHRQDQQHRFADRKLHIAHV